MPAPFATVRAATHSDEQAIFKLARQLATSFVVERDAFTVSFLRILQTPDIYLHVAETSGQVIAYLLGWCQPAFYANGPVAWVQEIVVLPEHRRLGIGKRLMAHFEGWALERQCKLVSLASRRAGDFYQAIGYAESALYYKKAITPN
jgi:GNAT superfamily N-acetyltransferase